MSEVVRGSGTMVRGLVFRCWTQFSWDLAFYLRAFLTSSYSVASLVCLVPVESRRARHDSHRLIADHNSRAVHDRSRCRHGSSRFECLPQSATGFSLFTSFHHLSRPSCPDRHVEQSSRAVHDPHKSMQQIFQIRSSCATERDAVHAMKMFGVVRKMLER